MKQSLFSKYVLASRYLRDDVKTFSELVDRLVRTHNKNPNCFGFLKLDSQDRFLLENMCVFPSMRTYQFLDSIHKVNERVYNCSGMIADRIDVLYESFFLLLSGCGVGINILKKFVDRLPRLKKPNKGLIYKHVVEDSIHGWAMAVKELVYSYISGNHQVEFDYSKITPRGVILSSCRRPAPGSDTLRESIEKCRSLLDECSNRGKLRPIDVFDFICIISRAVLSGGVRRSALIFGFGHDDEDMLNAKVGEWWKHHPHRSSANISVICPPTIASKIKKDWFLDMFHTALNYGEPGILFIEENQIVNPCAEIKFEPWVDGVSGYQFCNLTEICLPKLALFANGSSLTYKQAGYTATKLGLIQSLYCNFKINPSVPIELSLRDRLLGVSLTGWYDSRDASILTDIKRGVGEALTEFAKQFPMLNIPVRVTTVKPSGTVSCIADCSSGVHPRLMRQGIRYVQETKDSEFVMRYAKIFGEEFVFQSPLYKNVSIIGFPFITKFPTWEDVSIKDFLKEVSFLHKNWVSSFVKGFSNSVSATALIKDKNEVEVVVDFLLNSLKSNPVFGMTVLGLNNDYDFAPYTPAFKNLDRFNSLMEKFSKVTPQQENYLINSIVAKDEDVYCDTEKCVLTSG